MINIYSEENKLFPRQSGPEQENGVKWYYIVPSISVAVVLLVAAVLLARRYMCSRNSNKVETKFTTSNIDPNSAEYIYQHVYQNHKNPVYLVPYSALPENFDFSRSDITVRGDYIILKDLHVLEQPVIRPPSTPTTPVTPTASFPQIHFEGYQRQPPYNPNVYY